MDMQPRNRKGFLLLDSLISVFVTCLLCATCYMIYSLMSSYDDGYINYQSRSNNNLESIFNNLSKCEECEIDEPY